MAKYPVLGVLIIVALSSCTNGNHGNAWDHGGSADSRFELTAAERQAVMRTHELLNLAAQVLTEARLSPGQRRRLAADVNQAKHDLEILVKARVQGRNRQESLARIGVVAAGVVGDDALVIGTADDVLLLGAAIFAIHALITKDGPTSADELSLAAANLSRSMQRLGTNLQQIGNSAAPIGAARLNPRPAPQRVPVAPPAAREDEDRRRSEECKPKPVCPHKGGDAIHNDCADRVLRNRFSGCDVGVGGKAFDALDPNGVLWEVKTTTGAGSMTM